MTINKTTTITSKVMSDLDDEFDLTGLGVAVTESHPKGAVVVRFIGPHRTTVAQRRNGDKGWSVFAEDKLMYRQLKRADAFGEAARLSTQGY